MTSSATSNVGDDKISIVTGHPVHQNYQPIPNKNDDEFPKPETCCEHSIKAGMGIFVLVFFIMMITQSDIPPTPLPNFSVSSFTGTFTDATSSYQIALNFTVRKPESDSIKTIAYDNIVVSLYYDNNFVGKTALFPFKQENEINSVAVIKAKFTVDPKIVDVGVVGVYDVRVVAKAVTDKGQRRNLDVFCKDIRVESGSMAEPTKDCHVEGWFVL